MIMGAGVEVTERMGLLPMLERQHGRFSLLWPGNRHPSARLRVFIDYTAEHLFARPR